MAYKTRVTPEWDTDQKGRNPALTGQKHDVWLFVQENPYTTRNEIARLLGLKSSTATARVKELIDDGLLIETPHSIKGKAGVNNKTLIICEDFKHKGPRDKVRVEVRLQVDSDGNYHAKARVVGGNKKKAMFHATVLTKEFTLVAPYPNEYFHKFSDAETEKVAPTDTLANAKLIVDN